MPKKSMSEEARAVKKVLDIADEAITAFEEERFFSSSKAKVWSFAERTRAVIDLANHIAASSRKP